MTAFIEKVRPTSWLVLTLAIFAIVGRTLFWSPILATQVVRETFGLGNRTAAELILGTLINWIDMFVIVGIVLFRVGRLRPSDVGWSVASCGRAMLVTLGFWVAMQPGLALFTLVKREELQWNDAWSLWGPGYLLGTLLSQLLGNALLEETLYRGFLLPQFYLKTSGVCRKSVALALAVLGSTLLFALTHLPDQIIFRGRSVDDLLVPQCKLILQGLSYCAVYLVTRNIFVAVGLHSLFNQPARLLPVPFSPGVEMVWYSLVAILLLAWPLARRRMSGWAGPHHASLD